MTVSRLIARPLLASGIVVGAVHALRNADSLAPEASRVTERVVPLARKAAPRLPIPSDPATLVRLNAGIQLVSALALATNRAPRLSALVLVGSLATSTLAGHPFQAQGDPARKQADRIAFAKNASLLGGLLIAAGDTEGRPGVAWRARRAAKDARREARHLATSARREARLAKAQLV